MQDCTYFDGYHFFIVDRNKLENEIARYNSLGYTILRSTPTSDESKIGLIAQKIIIGKKD